MRDSPRAGQPAAADGGDEGAQEGSGGHVKMKFSKKIKLLQIDPRVSWGTWGMPAGPETPVAMAYGLLIDP